MILSNWFRRLRWPLVWRSTYAQHLDATNDVWRRQCDRLDATAAQADAEAATQQARADTAESLASRLREVVDAITQDVPDVYLSRNPAWRLRGRHLVREADARVPRLAFAAMGPVEFRLDPVRPTAVRTFDVPMVRLGLTVGLSDGCPPEVVADAIAEKVRAAVLEQWKGQRVLPEESR